MSTLDFGPLVLGGNAFGWTTDRDESFAVLDAFVAGGGRTIDTADMYAEWIPGKSGGESETIVGAWLASRGRRDDVVLASKVGKYSVRAGLAPANIRAAVEDSLRRLGTDRLDLYYAHEDDDSVPQEDTLAAFDELVRAGTVRELGASNFTADRLRSAAEIAEREGLASFTVSQDPYNLVRRDVEVEVLPAVRGLGLVELPYTALASGFLSGKYRDGAEVSSGRSDSARRFLDDPRNTELLETAAAIGDDHGVGVAAVALAWLRQRPGVGAPIASARTPEQLAGLEESYGLVLEPEELARLE